MPNKFEPASWVNARAALNTVATRLALFMGPGGADETAMSVLGRAIISGEIPACLSGEKAARKADYWKTVGADWGFFPPFLDIDLHRLGLEAWLATHDAKPISGKKRGPKATWDWEGCLVSITARVMSEGVPPKQAVTAAWMAEWFTKHQGQAPRSGSEYDKRTKIIHDFFANPGN